MNMNVWHFVDCKLFMDEIAFFYFDETCYQIYESSWLNNVQQILKSPMDKSYDLFSPQFEFLWKARETRETNFIPIKKKKWSA